MYPDTFHCWLISGAYCSLKDGKEERRDMLIIPPQVCARAVPLWCSLSVGPRLWSKATEMAQCDYHRKSTWISEPAVLVKCLCLHTLYKCFRTIFTIGTAQAGDWQISKLVSAMPSETYISLPIQPQAEVVQDVPHTLCTPHSVNCWCLHFYMARGDCGSLIWYEVCQHCTNNTQRSYRSIILWYIAGNKISVA